ncbi:KEOPS complex Pcc1-like subunit [Halovivax asiaticus JCM 14624]|uniref:KEOPS complex Pcc1-like subunit n=1 Tax=Halovivax asiaticus JCM 14624 TaxID=1227490 RepID=M0BVN0_9EURY|nr:KEOPS complex subunit Pcc1 [Halovivax asiaticus]ELZ13729.1 KEOPS complex Pcc1-like subunit [Halovivax asiaticus JCM 14624]
MTERVHETTLSFSYSSASRARLVARSVDQEVGAIDDDRSETRLTRDGSTVELTIDAADLTALRAAANTWLTLVDVAERTQSIAAAD